MKVGEAIPKRESLYKGSLTLPTFITPSEAPDGLVFRLLALGHGVLRVRVWEFKP